MSLTEIWPAAAGPWRGGTTTEPVRGPRALARGEAAAERGVATDTSAGKALALLDAFDGPRGLLGVTELAAKTNMPKSTAHRLLAILVARSYVRRVDDRYCLAARVFEVGHHVRACRPYGLRERAMPFMAELFAETRATIHLATLVGPDVLFLEKVFGHAGPQLKTAVGARRPAYATALGKAMLAFAEPATVAETFSGRFERITPYTLSPAQLERALVRVRADGYATDQEESTRGVACVAAPLTDPRTGLVHAAISIAYASTQHVEGRFRRHILRVADSLSVPLGPAPGLAGGASPHVTPWGWRPEGAGSGRDGVPSAETPR